ncbi:putative 6-hydroxy-D-nicotine oxidase [Glarea lozoyensis 74030]|uniref:Putative 6-hydroxy-D-nicotine oxidase n=1 Tax=Glarea lozoyensis (strain ATCC 74030 / MF5533) TaxID=1104152 RepID=H0ESG5_GLAL7|nr:putative 6-hydroxy-D-nicotine oxidase [Glarea lozoyensis 74030]
MKVSAFAVAAIAQTVAVQASSAHRFYEHAANATNGNATSNGNCYCFPGDACWPSESTWAALNTTTSGRLIATTPIGSPCHAPNYDEAACAAIQSAWTGPQIHLSSSSSVMTPFFANQSCDPFTPQTQACLLGNYVRYAVDVQTVDDIVAGVKFAADNNVRFVVRNTGHDFLGRSTGAGALSVWTHNLKDIDFIDNYSDKFYTGKAAKVGAGVLGYEMLTAAKAKGVVVVSGTCPTVGLAGGYTQGGGHSALSFDVVTAAGKLVTASRTKNSDLYWALSGGGGGNYGIVTSMTVKTHPDAKIGGASLQLSTAYTTKDTFYSVVSEFHRLLPDMVDAGTMVVFVISSTFLQISPVTGYNKTADEMKAIMAPFVAVLNAKNVPFAATYTEFDSYYDHYAQYMGPLPMGHVLVEEYQFASRLLPRSVIKNNNDGIQAVLRNATQGGAMILGLGLDVSKPGDVDNAVLPAWRDALIHSTFVTIWDSTAPWSSMVADQDKLTNVWNPALKALTPGSGSYMNEADYREPDFQTNFFGANYEKLLAIKKKWDPKALFYATVGVGSEFWEIKQDGHMCRIE